MTSVQFMEGLDDLFGDNPKEELRLMLEFYASHKYDDGRAALFLIGVEKLEATLNEWTNYGDQT